MGNRSMWGEGTVLAGRYELRRRIGGGSMGDVWQAQDTVLGRLVAVKILLPALLDDAGFAARFHTEARVLAALSHPGIVSVYDYGETTDPRTAFLVMELITGRPLSDLLEESAPLSEAATLTLVAQTLEALQAAHDQGIVHRDVKPANLMLRGGAVVVTDFGVARTADARRLTAADVVLGTAVYAAPEQARHSAVTAAADQYAVGVIAYECLTGAPPFDGDSPLGIMMKHLQEPVPPLPDTVSPAVRALVLRALAKDPGERFGSAREMAETARRIAAGQSSITRIGKPQDSFQTGVDVAAAVAATPKARPDGDFLSFTVVPKAEEPEGLEGLEGPEESAELEAPEAEAAEMPKLGGEGEEIAPPWASYAIRPPSGEGRDWVSFAVVPGSAPVEEPASTEPLPDEDMVSTVPLPDGETEPEEAASARPGRLAREDSFTAGLPADEEPVGAPVRQAPALKAEPREDSFMVGVPTESAEPAKPPPSGNRRRALIFGGVGVVVAAAVGIAVAYPSSHSDSAAPIASAASTGQTAGAAPSSSAPPAPSTSAASSSSSSAAPPPVSAPPSSGPPHKSGQITNVGDGDSIDVFGNPAGAPQFGDGSAVTVEPPSGRPGQTFQATAATAGGRTVYQFGDSLDPGQVIDADSTGTGKIALYRSLGNPNQQWWLANDANTPKGAFYLHNEKFNDCLTDNGAGKPVTLKPCVPGDKAQQWYLP
ncbi:MAG: protein kinase [Catenulispora sp.]|nr:protein kinase [Catenulispora sp.]